MKRKLLAIALLLALAVPAGALAVSFHSGNTQTVPKGETHSGTWFAAGQVVTVDGDVDGDVICAANTVTVNGTVRGDVLCVAQSITINGAVEGNVRVAGQSVNLNGAIARNGMVATQSLTLGTNAKINGDLGVASQSTSLNGPVTRDVYGAMHTLALAAPVGAVTAAINELTISGDGKINGDLNYTSENNLNVDKSKVTGTVKHTEPQHGKATSADEAARASLAGRLYWMLAALLIGLTMVWLAPRHVRRITEAMRQRPGATIGWGLVIALITPILMVLLLLTVIGVPLAFLIALGYTAALIVGGILAGIAAGEWFVDRAEWRGSPLLWAALVGVSLSVIIFSIPILGWVVAMVATWWGLGGLFTAARHRS
jgi:cytoskeletal protein CcmA (bactofilin family)